MTSETTRQSPLFHIFMVLFTIFSIPIIIALPFLLTGFIRLW